MINEYLLQEFEPRNINNRIYKAEDYNKLRRNITRKNNINNIFNSKETRYFLTGVLQKFNTKNTGGRFYSSENFKDALRRMRPNIRKSKIIQIFL